MIKPCALGVGIRYYTKLPAEMIATGIQVREEKEEIYYNFLDIVNMSYREIEHWLFSPEAQSMGQKSISDEPINLEVGIRTLSMISKEVPDLFQHDYVQMQRSIERIHTELAKRPEGEIKNSAWRYNLMFWGHDPLLSGHNK